MGCGLIGGLGRVSRWAAEKRSVATLSNASPSAPNVLLVVLDAVRATNLSTHGYARRTAPRLEALAREGVSYERAFSAAPWTLPSHASMFTGRYPNELRANFVQRLEPGRPTLGVFFRHRGYRTAAFTANEFYTAWDAGLGRAFERWSDYQVTWKQIQLTGWPWQTDMVAAIQRATGWREVAAALRYSSLRAPHTLQFDRKHSDHVRREFLAWHATVPAGRPFFAFLNLFDAHRPRYAPPEYDERFSKTPKGVDRFDNAIAYIDQELGLLIDALRSRGALDHTVVVVVADHGELLGEHGLYGHSTSVYRDVLWVPLVVRYPARISAGARVASPVSLRDLAPTIVDLAGASGPSPGFPGTSLASLPSQPDGPRSAVFSYGHQGVYVDPAFPNAAGAVYSLVMDSLQYVRHPGNAEFLFNLASSADTLNLLHSPQHGLALETARRTVADLTRDPTKP